jgi:anti-sigma regulatory factor (Ser/Thr protein kinase)
MEVTLHARAEVADPTGSGHARRMAMELARKLGFDEEDTSRVALVVTELATNLVKHADGGEMLLRSVTGDGRSGLAILALDRGPGIADTGAALRDGYSTRGTQGTGLGAVRRQASRFDLYSSPERGSAVFAELWPGAKAPDAAFQIGGVNVPFPGESVSGDAWQVACAGPKALALLVDGLGHGSPAAEAARVGLVAFDERKTSAPSEVLGEIHAALRPTRGAAAAVAELDRSRSLVRFAGVGNIGATIVADGTSRSLVSHHGTAGHQARRIQEFQYPWQAGASLILQSDGLVSRWSLDGYPGLTRRHPALIAGVLYRDFRRGRDDASVLVLQEAA